MLLKEALELGFVGHHDCNNNLNKIVSGYDQI